VSTPEAHERRGGQAMMRLGRRATLLVALSLLHLGRDKLRRGGVGV
jgi:hypothetical protein